jgi:hypothetical protein
MESMINYLATAQVFPPFRTALIVISSFSFVHATFRVNLFSIAIDMRKHKEQSEWKKKSSVPVFSKCCEQTGPRQVIYPKRRTYEGIRAVKTNHIIFGNRPANPNAQYFIFMHT